MDVGRPLAINRQQPGLTSTRVSPVSLGIKRFQRGRPNRIIKGPGYQVTGPKMTGSEGGRGTVDNPE